MMYYSENIRLLIIYMRLLMMMSCSDDIIRNKQHMYTPLC